MEYNRSCTIRGREQKNERQRVVWLRRMSEVNKENAKEDKDNCLRLTDGFGGVVPDDWRSLKKKFMVLWELRNRALDR